ncbi:MAG TPA: DMT family transporter [Thermoanaerobaculia bacterium]|nr:DMT family transporter [Thermoanaerobaculia bacterium]
MSIGLMPLLLVLAASVASSGFDLFRKMLVRDLAPVPMVFLLATASVPLFGAAVAFGGPVDVQGAYWWPALGSVALNVVANLTFLEAVRISPLSVTVPLLSLTPVFTALLGFGLLGERLEPLQIAGIVLVVIGAFWLNVGMTAGAAPESGGERRSLARSFLSQPGAWMMAGTALLLSLTIPLDKLAVNYANPPFHGLILTAGIAFGTLIVLAVQNRWGELAGLRRGWLPFLLALASSTLALGFQLVALKFVFVSLIETLKRGIGNLLAVILGRAVFHEPLTPGKVGAALLMAVGVALILL